MTKQKLWGLYVSDQLFLYQWQRFTGLAEQLCDKKLAQQPAEGVLKLTGEPLKLLNEKTTLLTIMGLVHGNEVGGLAVINEILQLVAQGLLSLKYPVTFVLGNIAAAQRGKRFLESDLNRSFAASSNVSIEQKRAAELSTFLGETALLLDIHQTRQPSEEPFFIFPYNRRALDFARAIDQSLPVITHWGRGFSKDGMCSDEYVNSRGGLGITVELGQNGFHPYQIGMGVKLVLNSLFLANQFRDSLWPALAWRTMPVMADGPLYTFGHIQPWPAGANVELVSGLYNFKQVEVGQHLGLLQTADQQQSLTAPVSGRLLFPKYLSAPDEKPPAEAFRILREIAQDELPPSL